VEPTVELEATELTVQPGQERRVPLTVKNRAEIVDGYDLVVVGEPAAWCRVEPAKLTVYPGRVEAATLVVSPPAGPSVTAGRRPFGLRVTSEQDARRSTVAQGWVDVAAEAVVVAELHPQRVRGRLRAGLDLRLSASGNRPLRLRARAVDPADQLAAKVEPAIVDLPPGGQAKVRVSTKFRPGWGSARQDHTLNVAWEEAADAGPAWAPRAPTATPSSTSGTLPAQVTQLPILSRAVKAGAVLAVVAAGALATYLFLKQAPAPIAAPLVATPTAADAVRVAWERPPGDVDGFDVVTLNGAEDGDERKTEDAAADQSSLLVTGLDPASRFCFEVFAVKRGNRSGPSPPACADTLAPAPLGDPANLVVGPVSPDGMTQLTWEGPAEYQYHVFRNGAEVTVATSPASVEAQPGNNCFTVVGDLGGARSKMTEPACVEVPADGAGGAGGASTTAATAPGGAGVPGAPGGSATPGGNGQGGTGQGDWVAVLTPADDGTVSSLIADFTSRGITVSTQPGGPPGVSLIIVGEPGDRTTASAACAQVQQAHPGTQCCPLNVTTGEDACKQ
jgi:hypothetical protein